MRTDAADHTRIRNCTNALRLCPCPAVDRGLPASDAGGSGAGQMDGDDGDDGDAVVGRAGTRKPSPAAVLPLPFLALSRVGAGVGARGTGGYIWFGTRSVVDAVDRRRGEDGRRRRNWNAGTSWNEHRRRPQQRCCDPSSDVLSYEADLPAEQSGAEAAARVPAADEHEERPAGVAATDAKAALEDLCLTTFDDRRSTFDEQ